MVLLGGFGRNEAKNGWIDLELVQRNGGDAVLLAEEGGDLLVFDEAQADQAVTELASTLTLRVQRLLELLRGNALLLEKKLSNTDRHMNGPPDPAARGATISTRIAQPKASKRDPGCYAPSLFVGFAAVNEVPIYKQSRPQADTDAGRHRPRFITDRIESCTAAYRETPTDNPVLTAKRDHATLAVRRVVADDVDVERYHQRHALRISVECTSEAHL